MSLLPEWIDSARFSGRKGNIGIRNNRGTSDRAMQLKGNFPIIGVGGRHLQDKDQEHLRLLAIFHYVVAGLCALFACFPLIHVSLGLMLLLHPSSMTNGQEGGPPATWIGFLFIVIGGIFVLLGWAMAVCTFISGRYISSRRRRTFSFVMAAILCMFMPFGTVLGIFTIIVLSKESVQQLYLDPPEQGQDPAN